MKRIIVVLIIAFLAFVGLGSPAAQAAGQDAGSKVIAYYFHGNFRCYSCTLMEQYIKEAIETNFKDALAAGKLEFKAVNVEERGNEHFINDYQLYTKALILSLVKDGKEIRSKNLTRIWEYVRNKQRFFDYVASETKALLEEAK